VVPESHSMTFLGMHRQKKMILVFLPLAEQHRYFDEGLVRLAFLSENFNAK
jgi:hypothetical protein